MTNHHTHKQATLKTQKPTKQRSKTTQFYIIYFMEMAQKKTKAEGIAITYAPQLAKRLRAEELKDKNGSFLVIYQEGEPDGTGDKIYRVGLYKMVQYAPIRQEGNLAELLDFVAQNKNVQILNADAYDEKGAK